ncbi:putative membrane protein [Vibrio cholerae HE-25]|nr:putative membrane protein [Vibrio cholerae HE-25]
MAAALATFVLPHSLSGLMGMNVLAAVLLAVILQRSFIWE